jgi:CubicO group peptidase (beta-lactamase class C family)
MKPGAIMKNIFLVLLMPLQLLSQSNSNEIHSKIIITEAQIAVIDSIINAAYKPDEPGAAVLLAQNGKILLRKGYGMANMELHVPVSPNHVFAIASMTKYFTAVSILLLQEQGKLNIKNDIRKFIPLYNTHGRSITLENLMTHTSGIVNDRESPSYWAKLKLETSRYAGNQFAEEQLLLFEPGTDFSYSNPSFRLLAFVIEKVSGKSYNEFIQQHIFDKLGMKQTYPGTSASVSMKTSSYAYNQPRRTYERYEDGPYVQFGAVGAGSFFSTVDDLYLWHMGLKEGKIISVTSLKKAWTSYILANGSDAHYGYGRSINTISGHLLVGHSGGLNGYQSYEWQLPDDDIYFVILSNQGRDIPIPTLLANKIGSFILDTDQLPNFQMPDSIELTKVKGIYESLADGSRLQKNMSVAPFYWKIWPEQGKLYVKRTGASKIELLPFNDSTWYTKTNPFNRWTFRKDKSGNVTGVKTYGSFIQIGPERFGKKISSVISSLPPSLQIDSTDLVKYNGIFQHESGIRVKLITRENKLVLTDEEGIEVKELSFAGNDVFFDPISEILYKFMSDKKGEITGLKFFDTRGDMLMKRIRNNY